MQVDALIRELLATGQMNEDTTADLNRMLAESQAGTLHPDDLAYVEALHARLSGTELPASSEVSDLDRLDGLTIADWRDRALRAEAELAQIKDDMTRPS